MMQDQARKVLGLIDLTSLNDNDNPEKITNLCKNANSKFGNVPAICIYSRFIQHAKEYFKQHNQKIKIATVTNFPHGSTDLDIALYETDLAINRGADEVDIVFPYHALIDGDNIIGAQMIFNAKKICKNKTLKVIIESGELKTQELIELASKISIDNGADFIKTSTGKVKVNSTLESAEIMLQVIKSSGTNCGFKAAGGIRTVKEAIEYLDLAANLMGKDWISSEKFRFGASALLSDVMNILSGSSNNSHASY